MSIHNLRRHSNTSYMCAMDMGCSLKGSTASIKEGGMVYTLASGWISANLSKSVEASVVVTK
jgi:hypothetical protein